VNAAATSKHRDLLERLNSGTDIPGFADGGIVGSQQVAVSRAPQVAMPYVPMAVPAGGPARKQEVEVHIKADASPYLLLETDTRARNISKAGDRGTLKSADRQAPQRMAKFNQLGT
jgi:hypothetical protein